MYARSRRGTVGPAIGVAVGVAVAVVTLLVSRITGVPTPTVLAAGVATAWLATVGVVVARSVAAVTRDDATDTARPATIGYAEGASTADSSETGGRDGRRESEPRLEPRPELPAWLESDETPWIEDPAGEKRVDDRADGGRAEEDTDDGAAPDEAEP